MDMALFKLGGKNRMLFLERLYEQNIGLFSGIPQIGLGELNQILGEYFDTNKMPRLNLVLLKLVHFAMVKPTERAYMVKAGKKKAGREKRLIYEYYLRFLDRLYLVNFSKASESKIVCIKLNVKTMHFSWSGYFREESKIIRLPHILRCADFTAGKFKTAVGMGVKKTEKNGSFKIGCQRIMLGREHSRQIVLIFFDQGKLFCFDLKGHWIKGQS